MSARQLQKNGAARVAAWAITRKVPLLQLILSCCRAGIAAVFSLAFINSSKRYATRSNSASECWPSNFASSTRAFPNTLVTWKVRSIRSRPGMTSARKVKAMPTLTSGDDRGFRLRGLRMSVNEPPHAIGKQHIHLLRFDDGRDFALTECRMQ